METSIMLAMLRSQSGDKHENTQACFALLDILRNEYSERHNGKTAEPQTEPEPVVAKEKIVAPKTFEQLMCLGDGNVKEPEMVKKP
jgi:hypothetical protein